jgi:hypothetical protein
MKILGIILITLGVLLFFAPLFLPSPKDNGMVGGPSVRSDNGETMQVFPLLGIVSVATGGALVVAEVLTKKRK